MDITFLVIYTLRASAFGEFLADVNNWESKRTRKQEKKCINPH